MRNKDINIIKFPQRVYAPSVEKLFAHLGEDLKAEVDYTLILSYRRGYSPLTKEKEKNRRQQHYAGASGIIRFPNHRWLNFNLVGDREQDRTCFFYTGVKFDIDTERSIEERKRSPTQHPDDVEAVRTSIDKYFPKT
ncbi:hypothetical protein HYW75_00875 [Candidatus Pacearchaeota archaeon]|nr:hypothetical protein [Candidatus Pacearchaeota archaeon]